MLLVDYRDGSKELLKPLMQVKLPAEIADLNSGDLAFSGRGEKGEDVLVGIEHKKWPDLLDSLRSNRINEQARKMQADYKYRYLMVQGEIRIGEDGRFQRRCGRRSFRSVPGPTASEAFKRVFVLHLAYGLTPIFVPDGRTATKVIEFLYRVWTDEDMDAHKSHLGLYMPSTQIGNPDDFDIVVGGLPEVGRAYRQAAKKQFRSIRRAINAGPAAWAELEAYDKRGNKRKFGLSRATKLEHAITKGDA